MRALLQSVGAITALWRVALMPDGHALTACSPPEAPNATFTQALSTGLVSAPEPCCPM